MTWSELHAQLLATAFEEVLDKPSSGTMAFVRCLTPNVVDSLANDVTFSPSGWQVHRVGNANDVETRSVTADKAVELREMKRDAVLLLVDTELAGAGMDGIYSAAREVDESGLFGRAISLAAREVTHRLSRTMRQYAESAIKNARQRGQRFSISKWAEFDFLVRVAVEQCHPGELIYLLGLWPVLGDEETDSDESLNVSRIFTDRLLSTATAGLTPQQRIDSLRLHDPSEEQITELHRFLRSSSTKPLLPALSDLADKKHLWIGSLRREGEVAGIQSIEIVTWRNKNGTIARWSGLIEGGGPDDPPELILNPDADRSGDYSKLEIRWKVRPDNLAKDSVEYQVVIETDMDEEVASQEIPHTGKSVEKCRFTNDHFPLISEDAVIGAKLVIFVIGDDTIEKQESEEFIIRFGEPPESPSRSVGKKVRTFSEGLIELEDRETVSSLVSSEGHGAEDSKGFVLLRAPQYGKSFRVFRPSLIREVEQQWDEDYAGAIGRWRVKVRTSGARAGKANFERFDTPDASSPNSLQPFWDRVTSASQQMAKQFTSCGGGVGQIYDEKSKVIDSVAKEYLLAWAALLEKGDSSLALANTIEIQSLSGRTIGLIVLPSHPLRVAWHTAYDNLVLHAKFEQGVAPKQIVEEFRVLDGAMFPAFLPGPEDGTTFVFADTLGFHAVGMVPDSDKEPKASISIMSRAIGENDTEDMVPTVGKQSSLILGNEIVKYVDGHHTSKLLKIHALRPGDGLTVARALGHVNKQLRKDPNEEDFEEIDDDISPAFVLELYPSEEQRGVSGRFIAETREKRRRGAGVLAPKDLWMLESLTLPGGVNVPKLRWARKEIQDPETPAHIAVAFDTFESRVVSDQPHHVRKPRPLLAYGMISFFEREYTSLPSPLWSSTVLPSTDGEKHPSDRTHTDRLVRLQQIIQRCVARNIANDDGTPTLKTEISPEKALSLRKLHGLCDWVITIDRNAGIEYFDSPKDNKEIYEAYVIDCVPEREDLGSLQMITSTSNLSEVRILLDSALDQIGLSRSLRNAEFLMEHLKALSGRLAIRLTGPKTHISELIALALSNANCEQAINGDSCWTPLREGFLIPVDDVLDLIPPLSEHDKPLRESEATPSATMVRPDLLYVSIVPRKGLLVQFIEVKYRQDLRSAQSPDILQRIRQQVESLHQRWDDWYSGTDVAPSLRAIRRAKLARVMRFYADKAHRHYLPTDRYEDIIDEIDRMVGRGGTYTFATADTADRGWVFCPEFSGSDPLEISPAGWDTRIFMFGPRLLPHGIESKLGSGQDTLRASAGRDRNGENSILHPTESPTEHLKDNAWSDEHQSQTDSSSESEISAIENGQQIHPDESSDLAHSTNDIEPSVSLGTDLFTGLEVRWPLTVKGNPHLLLAGLPGMGKTTILLNLCKQMLEVGVRPIVFSYHQDIDDGLSQLVNSVRFIDFDGLGFNPLQIVNRESRFAHLDVAGAMRDIFAAIYPELGDIQGERIRKAIKESFTEQGWDDSNVDLSTLPEPTFRRFVDILRAEPKPDRGLRNLLGRLDELDDYRFFDLAETQTSLWNTDQPIVIRIHATQNNNVQKAFSSLVFYGLYKDMFQRGIQQRITHAIIFDEAHRAARLQLIPTMAKECRKYGISLVLASQEAKDFNVSLFSTIGNYLVLRLNEADAKALVRNVASSDRERMLVDRIKGMERFKALYFSEEKKPSQVSLLPP